MPCNKREPGTGCSAIKGYNVYEGTSADGESTMPVNSSLVTSTSYTATGLTDGTKYYFVVKAVNSVGGSAASNEVSATPTAGRPIPERAPTFITTSLSGVGQFGSIISVPSGTAVNDQASLSGANSSTAGGMVTYGVYTLSFFRFPFVGFWFFSWWGWRPVASGGTVHVTNGTVPASNPVTLGPGTYFWQASYSGDTFNGPSESTIGTETEVVVPTPPHCPIGLGWLTVWCLNSSGGSNGSGTGYAGGGGHWHKA